jgi:hypothetical protein
MHMKIFLKVVFLSSFLAAPSAHAWREIPDLTKFVAQEVSTMSRAVEESGMRQAGLVQEASALSASDDRPSYYFRQFMVRVRTFAGFSVPWLVSFEVVPEVELVWQRNMPKFD